MTAPSPASHAELLDCFRAALADLEARHPIERFSDSNVDAELRRWLDGPDAPLPWSEPAAVSSDEWFFITTLCGDLQPDAQRTQIRKHFATLFVARANRDIRSFRPELVRGAALWSSSMTNRLCKMGEILRDRGQSMSAYVAVLKKLERDADLRDPMPALDALVLLHQTTAHKTLSHFIRDCVLGNAFPLDAHTLKQLAHYNLPPDERLLVTLSLELNRNPRPISRLLSHAASRP